MTTSNPLGPPVPSHPASLPERNITFTGHHVTLTGLSLSHSPDLWDAVGGLDKAPLWDYMSDGPFASPDSLQAYLTTKSASLDPVFYAIRLNQTGKVVGYAGLMKIDTLNRVIDVGPLMFSPTALQRTPAATETQYLLARYAFETLGYRRYQWKCNSLNAPSRRAAERLGFRYEGTFRKDRILKGRSRDTAWFSIVEEEWEGVKRALEGWLGEENFGPDGRQRRRLKEFRA
ncbi:hypothetical protein M8818_007895 [Zalaria obscura]|uniref:Uncharacterized protein n=1 Tax=Zalaria obscura TaxID=2024903 RepID=A0ACC3S3N4_9PEZI